MSSTQNVQIVFNAKTGEAKIKIKDLKDALTNVGTDAKATSRSVIEGMDQIPASAGRAAEAVDRTRGSLNNIKDTAVGMYLAQAFQMGISKIEELYTKSQDLWKIQEQADMKIRALVKTTGDASGFTVKQLYDMADQMQKVTTIGNESAENMIAKLLTFKSIQGDNFRLALKTAADMGSLFGNAEEQVLLIGKALDDPATQMSYLHRTGISFTKDQENTIKKLEAQGNLYQAQRTLLNIVQGQLGGVAEAIAKTNTGQLQQMDNKWGDIGERIGKIITNIKVDLIPEIKNTQTAINAMLDSFDKKQSVHELAGGGFLQNLIDYLPKSGVFAVDHFFNNLISGYGKSQNAAKAFMDNIDLQNKKIDTLISSSASIVSEAKKLRDSDAATAQMKKNYNQEIQHQITLLDGQINSTKATVTWQTHQVDTLDKSSMAWREANLQLKDAADNLGKLQKAKDQLVNPKMKAAIPGPEEIIQANVNSDFSGFNNKLASDTKKSEAALIKSANEDIKKSNRDLAQDDALQTRKYVENARERERAKQQQAQIEQDLTRQGMQGLQTFASAVAKNSSFERDVAATAMAIDEAVAISHGIKSAMALPFPADIIAGAGIAGEVLGLFGTVSTIFKKAPKAPGAPKFATGGEIGGLTHDQGGTIIEAERGEYLVNRASSSNAPGVLHYMNSSRQSARQVQTIFDHWIKGNLPKASNGGRIGTMRPAVSSHSETTDTAMIAAAVKEGMQGVIVNAQIHAANVKRSLTIYDQVNQIMRGS